MINMILRRLEEKMGMCEKVQRQRDGVFCSLIYLGQVVFLSRLSVPRAGETRARESRGENHDTAL